LQAELAQSRKAVAALRKAVQSGTAGRVAAGAKLSRYERAAVCTAVGAAVAVALALLVAILRSL